MLEQLRGEQMVVRPHVWVRAAQRGLSGAHWPGPSLGRSFRVLREMDVTDRPAQVRSDRERRPHALKVSDIGSRPKLRARHVLRRVKRGLREVAPTWE